MKKKLLIRPKARRDLLDQFVFIARDNQDAALRFLESAQKTFAELLSFPEMGTRQNFANPLWTGLRRWRIRHFEKHLIFYRPIKKGIEVIRVLYATRDIEELIK